MFELRHALSSVVAMTLALIVAGNSAGARRATVRVAAGGAFGVSLSGPTYSANTHGFGITLGAGVRVNQRRANADDATASPYTASGIFVGSTLLHFIGGRATGGVPGTIRRTAWVAQFGYERTLGNDGQSVRPFLRPYLALGPSFQVYDSPTCLANCTSDEIFLGGGLGVGADMGAAFVYTDFLAAWISRAETFFRESQNALLGVQIAVGWHT